MITLNKTNGFICIDNQEINPYENIVKIKLLLGGRLQSSLYGRNKESVFIFDDLSSDLSYLLEVNNKRELQKITIQPKYSSWDDVVEKVESSKFKIKSVLTYLGLKENNVFSWGKAYCQYDYKNLIPSISIIYL
ncbi:hypothetical protein HYE60_04650 [Aggregatibacter actinomycetemcomitans]|uniref:hypothetical protein n=1 Tax=Aggregatibacter actinomycetemcomitans TaxID=714 RepID=UPI00197C2DBC|nr:hypothetical protein [Aggregatibacter actinomycetemcomitans]MBN6074547.1 hypothetical protein [Aggregatibacter actinomycetemcomitans]